MSSQREDPYTTYLSLLHKAGLGRAEDVRRLSPTALQERLTIANPELKQLTNPVRRDLFAAIQAAAEQKEQGEITADDLQIPAERDVTRSYGTALAGEEDFRAWDRRDEEIDKAGLPGEEDFEPWRRG